MTHEYLTTLLSVISILISGGLLGVILKHRHGMQNLADQRSADIRDHYAEELERVIDRQRQCEERESRLRKRVQELENDILGLIRIIRQASADKVISLSPEVSETIMEMAERVSGRPRLNGDK